MDHRYSYKDDPNGQITGIDNFADSTKMFNGVDIQDVSIIGELITSSFKVFF